MDVRISTQDLDKTFLALPRSTRNKALTPALREGARVIQRAAILNVKSIAKDEVTGTLAKSIVVRSFRQSKGMLRAGVQIRKGAVHPSKKDGQGPVRVAVYAAVLEYGKEGQPPRSWIRKAIREHETAAVEAVRRVASRRMVDAVRDAQR